MPFPSNAVEETLAAARAGQVPDERLLESLAEAELWVPLPGGAAAEEPSGESTGQLKLPIMVIDDAKYVVVYTSEEQFKRCAGDLSAAVTPGRAFARTLPPELGIAVNPGGEVGLPVPPSSVQAIRGEAAGEEESVPAGAQIMLGEPADEPTELLDALRDTLAADAPEVASASRAWAKLGDRPEGLLLGIDVRPDDDRTRQSALQAVGAAVSRTRVPYGVDSVFLSDQTDPITAWFAENTHPFYVRPA